MVAADAKGRGARSAHNISHHAIELLKSLLEPAPPEAVGWIAYFEEPPSNKSHWGGYPCAATAELRINGSNAYYSIAAFRADAKQRTIEQALGAGVIVADDVTTKGNAVEVAKLLGEPSFKIQTSPQSQQWGYLLKQLATREQIDPVHKALMARGLCDQSGNNLVRYARLPCGINNKPEYGEPFAVHMLEWYPERRFDIAKIAGALGAGPRQKPKEDGAASPTGPIPKGTRNDQLFRYAASLRARNAARNIAWELLQKRNADCLPPLGVGELRTLFDSAWRYTPDYKCTDLGNAERLIDMFGDDLRFIVGLDKWTSFDEHFWTLDMGEQFVRHCTTTMIRSMYGQAAQLAAKAAEGDTKHQHLTKHALRSESARSIEAVVKIAAFQRTVLERIESFDTDPWLIRLKNGVFDLQRLQFRPGRREDLILKHMNVRYDPTATCARWEEFQRQIHPDDEELVAFKQRLWGYTCTGDAREEMFFLLVGEGANGKSTEMETIGELFGDYGLVIEPETIAKRDRPRADNAASSDVAEMCGRRLIRTSELEEGHPLAEQLIKRMTGRDSMAARMLYKERIRFPATGKLFIFTNHMPQIRGTEHAIWRRVCVIPYPVKFDGKDKDPTLKAKLVAESPGIFNWMVKGYQQWREQGLCPPSIVRKASVEYRSTQDRIGQFLRECVKHGPQVLGMTRANHVYAAYRRWCERGGTRPLSNQKFYDHLGKDHKLWRENGRWGKDTEFKNLLLIAIDDDDPTDESVEF